ncbi:MAG TPA: hypothetical protein VFP65_26775 [Anaeromyxobacteraceae bacterium]|nr:hypothetical protein [Anaeromyxobacteraceae bacterium]
MTSFPPRLALVLAAALALPCPASAAEGDCPAFDVLADADSAEVITKEELSGWVEKALGKRHAEGAPCFAFVAVVSANNASAAYLSIRTTSQGERVVLAETQWIATGTKSYRRNGLKKAIQEFVSEKAK